MRRGLIVCLVVLAGAGILTGVVSASTPRARLHGFMCRHALDPSNRTVSTTAAMRPRSGTKHMAMRFELLERTHSSPVPTEVTGGDLDTWITPGNPTLGQRPGDVWIVRHPVADLAAPAHYRFRVSFRWTASHGHVLGVEVRTSPSCYQPELRPDLLVISISVQPISGQPNSERYTAVIGNHGKTAAGPFQVWFTYGQVIEKRYETGLRPQTTLKESFVGPVCTTDTAPTVRVDPTHEVDDSNPANNAMTASCSTTTGT